MPDTKLVTLDNLNTFKGKVDTLLLGKQNRLTTTSVNDGTLSKNIGFDSNGNIVKGNVTTKVSELTNDSGFTTNTGTVTSVTVQTGTGLTGGSSTGSTTTGSWTICVDSSYKLPLSSEWLSLSEEVSTIGSYIPTQASASNQLADKEFVVNSVSTATASFRGTFESLNDLQATTGDMNDYAFYKHTDNDGNTVFDKYKYVSTTPHWVYEYTLNNSSFTSAQWSSINSGITSSLVAQITTNANNFANYVPTTRTINGKALSSNVTLYASDITMSSSSGANTISQEIATKQSALTTTSVSNGTLDKVIGFDSNGNIVKGTPSSDITITTTAGSESISDGTNTLNVVTRGTTQTISGAKTFSAQCSFTNSYGINIGAISTPSGVKLLSLTNLALAPVSNNEKDLGTSSLKWKDIYASGSLKDGTNSIAVANIENKDNKVTSLSSSSTDTQYPSAKLVYDSLALKENVSNKVASVSSSSTDTEYPSAKCVYDAIDNVTAVAEGKTKTFVLSYATTGNSVFNSNNATITTSSSHTTIGGGTMAVSDLRVGDVILVTETDVADRWVSDITSGTVTLSKMETAKIDLTNYPTKSDFTVSGDTLTLEWL